MADGPARLACRRTVELRRPRRRRPPIGGRLPGTGAVERRRRREDVVRPGEVAAIVPAAANRADGRHPTLEHLRGSRLLNGPAELRHALDAAAHALGFDAVGVVRPDGIPQARERLDRFLSDGWHGDMAYMGDRPERRADPCQLWPDVRSIIMLGMNYAPDEDPLDVLKRRDRVAISV